MWRHSVRRASCCQQTNSSGRIQGRRPDCICSGADALIGRILLTESGEEPGVLHDVYFLEKMGTIVAYETTDGFFSEITVVESKQPPELGKDAIMISVYDQ